MRVDNREKIGVLLRKTLDLRPDHVNGINYLNVLDPVSGHQDYYNVDVNAAMNHPGPWGVAHVQYWGDRAFFCRDIVDQKRCIHQR